MNLDPMLIALAAGIGLLVLAFWGAHRNPEFRFDVFDLVMENGRVSKIALAFMVVLFVSCWVIVDQQVKGKLESGTFGLWLTAWVTPLVAKVVFGKSESVSTTTLTATTITQEPNNVDR